MDKDIYFNIIHNVDSILDKMPCYELEIENIREHLYTIKKLCKEVINND